MKTLPSDADVSGGTFGAEGREMAMGAGVHLFAIPPLVLYAYPAVAGLLVQSEVPLILGRYSPFLFVFNVGNLVLYGLAAWAFISGRQLLKPCVYLLVVLASLLVPGNEMLRRMPLVQLVLPLVRLTAGIAVAYFASMTFSRSRGRGLLLTLAATVFIVSVIDLALLGWVSFVRSENLVARDGFREKYDLSRIEMGEIIIVGDSFVWGAGVAKEDAFGNVLSRMYGDKSKALKVYSLGVRGAGPKSYVEFLDMVPWSTQAAGRVIMSFYINDMPPRPLISHRLRQSFASLGKGSLFSRAIGDFLEKKMTPNVDQYHAMLVGNFDKNDDTFPQRWAMLEGMLRKFGEVAQTRSKRRPIFLIIPLMVNFENYPLVGAHEDLRLLAEKNGYRVIDLLPLFRKELGNGERYRVSRNDNHFNVYVHSLVARHIKAVLDQTE